jgi:hypothetical protein
VEKIDMDAVGRNSGDQHVQARPPPDLAYYQPIRTHARGFLDQPTQLNLAVALNAPAPIGGVLSPLTVSWELVAFTS